MAVVVEREQRELHPTHAVSALGALGWLAVIGAASLGAGAIHAAAIGVHAEHRQAVVAFTIVAVVQLAVGAVALARPGRIVLTLGAIANVVFIGGWVLAKTKGISFVDGLEVSEEPQMADSLAAGLALLAVLATGAELVSFASLAIRRSPLFTGAAAITVAALAVPGMLAAGSHTHSHGAAGHTHDAAAAGGHTHTAAVVPPKPYDPTLPIDLSGVEGVTPQQQAAAENLLAVTITRLPKFADPAVAEAQGFKSIGDGFLGFEHYLNLANMGDDKLLDPDYPESLVYDTKVTPKRLVAAMFMMNPGDTLADVPELGGKLTQWHVHSNLCFTGPRVTGLTDAQGNCRPGTTKGAETPMIHVWIESHPCGPFAALEGVGAGSIAEGETRLCDHVHGT
ncbi:MAG: hypothetical protein ACJ739_11405 [Acidimicrobiales bacterium]